MFTKGGLFLESAIRFSNLQISKKKIQKTILNLKFKFPTKNTVIGGKFKFQVQDSFLEYSFLEIWRFEKRIALSEKSHL